MAYPELKVPDIETNRLSYASKEELDTILNEIIQWLDSVHLAVFMLEQQQDDYDPNLLSTIESTIETMSPIIQTLEMIEELDDDNTRKVRKIQYEWSSLQHFSNSVKLQLKEVKLQHELGDTLNLLLLRLDDLSIYLFEIQERKQVVILKKETLEDEPIQDFDVRFDVIKSEFEPIMQQMARLKEAGLTKKYEKAREKLELLRFDRDELKSDHKEERWLTVFRKVADQVDVMMEGLDKSVIQCSGLVQQIIKSQQQQQYNNTFDKLSKSFFKAFHAPTSNSSIKPADKEKFRATEKSFEAKYKYYTPSIDRMLAMLGNGIATRASKDQATIQRHDEMIQRWQQLKHAADTLREHDLIEAARILHPTTTNTNSNTSNWKTIRYRTPTPSNEHKPYKTPTPTNSDSHPQLIRSSTSDSSSVSSISSGYFRTYRHFNTSSSNRRDDFYEQDEQEYGVDLVRKRSASVDKQQPAVTDVITTNTRYRSKSSMGNINRAMSPPRQRSFTPSLIPRPKTPNSDSRATSPLSSRPRSAQREMIPPVPFLEPATKKKLINQEYIYKPDKNDALDVEISHIVNTSPVVIECHRAQPGRYYFGNEASVSSIAGKKLYACKLMTYKDRKNGQFKRNKVLIRVGGGWQDLEFFLLEHSSFMSETSV